MSAPHPNDEWSGVIGSQLAALRRQVSTANRPGNLDGLFARYVMGGGTPIESFVATGIDKWLDANEHRLAEPAGLAVLGYLPKVDQTLVGALAATVKSGLERLMGRDPFPGDRLSFVHDVRILLGVHLAAQAMKDDLAAFQLWLRQTLEDSRLVPADSYHHLMQRHVLADLTGEAITLRDPADATDDDLPARMWMVDYGTAILAHPADFRPLQQRAAAALLRADPSTTDVPQAALLIRMADAIVAASADQMISSASHVGAVLRRFEAAMRRWRWDGDHLQHRIRWEIRSEREVQDILWIMLRSVFDHVVDEETLPKLGHSSYRADFGLPRLGVLIEVKYVRRAVEFKTIEQEVMIDSVAYLQNTDRYRELIVFIYDESTSVEHHDQTRRTLRGIEGISDVIIVSRPGIVPAPDRHRNRALGRSNPVD